MSFKKKKSGLPQPQSDDTLNFSNIYLRVYTSLYRCDIDTYILYIHTYLYICGHIHVCIGLIVLGSHVCSVFCFLCPILLYVFKLEGVCTICPHDHNIYLAFVTIVNCLIVIVII